MSRIDSLIAKMTLAEKLGQLTMTASSYAVTGPVIAGDSTQAIKEGTIGNLLNMVGADHVREMQRLATEESRLGIPLLIGFDIIHGHRTIFPIPLAEAGLFDPPTWALTARESAKEAAAEGLAMTFAPMLDVARDPRWGRSAEGPGEDGWLATRIAEAKVHGFQGTDLAAADSLAAVAKHFAAYGAVTAGREYAAVDISERSVREVYLPAFAAAVAGGVAAVMPAFTDLDGVPMTANGTLLRGWLREKMKFDGVIVTDYNAIAELVHHGIAADLPHAAALALNAGVDIDMMADAFRRGLPVALERGWVSMKDIDAAVRRVLRLKEQLGLFDDPYRRGAKPEPAEALSARRQLARSVAARAAVLLKNDGVLPLATGGASSIAVVGPLADTSQEMRGPWWGAAGTEGHVTVVEGLRGVLSAARVVHALGVEINGDDVNGIAAALDVCESADVILLCLGEAATMSGEAASRSDIGLPGRQRELAEAVLERAATLGKPVVAVVFSGRPLVIPWLAEKANALLAAWFLGSEAGNAIGDIVFGHVSPCGRTPVSWPRALGQVPIFFGQRPSGRPADPKDHYTSKYLDISNEPLFPFGFGLTYGAFKYSNLRVPQDGFTERETAVVRVDVTNEGKRAAEETVFLFTHTKVAPVTRPLLELKGFAKIQLKPGETGTVTLLLPVRELGFLGPKLEPMFQAGEVEVLVGPCAQRAQLLVGTLRLTAPAAS
jgi:beta-glucosidase